MNTERGWGLLHKAVQRDSHPHRQLRTPSTPDSPWGGTQCVGVGGGQGVQRGPGSFSAALSAALV